MKFVQTDISEVIIVEPTLHKDSRGYFAEIYRQNIYYEELGVNFVQENLSVSSKNVLRGLHYQLVQPQAKLVQVLQGAVLDVAVDIRQGSPTFGKYVTAELTGENHKQLFIPEGFAHGFLVLSEEVMFSYKCSNYYAPKYECGIAWNDPTIGIKWQVSNPILSDKDKSLAFLSEISQEKLPNYCIL